MSHMSDSDDHQFSLFQDWGKHIDFLIFFFTSEDKILETTSCQVCTTIKWMQWEWFSFEIFDDFLAIHYASVKQMHLGGLFGCHDRPLCTAGTSIEADKIANTVAAGLYCGWFGTSDGIFLLTLYSIIRKQQHPCLV